MKRFSFWTFILILLLHLIVSVYLVGGAASASYAPERGEPDQSLAWMVGLWVSNPVPMFLSRYVQPLRPAHLLYLVAPWSLSVAVCFGFLFATINWEATKRLTRRCSHDRAKAGDRD